MEYTRSAAKRVSGNGPMLRELDSVSRSGLSKSIDFKSIDMLTYIDKDLTVTVSFIVYIDGKPFEFSSLKKAVAFYENQE